MHHASKTPARSADDAASPVGPDDRFIHVEPPRLVDALARLTLLGGKADRARAERFIEFAGRTGLALDQCWAVEEPRGLGPVVLAVPNPGRTALLFVSRTSSEDAPRLSRLLRHAHDRMDRSRIALAQTLLMRHEREALRAFLDAGYTRIADLAYMERGLPRAWGERTVDWPEGVTLETHSPGAQSDFKTAVLDSYVDTLDCPALCGLRDIEDIMAGHRGAGDRFDPSLWTLVRRDGRPAAVLLLAAIPEQDTIELSYIGVGAAHRRLGLGRRLLDHGLAVAVRRGFSKMTLAVDEANEAAMRLYRARGFVVTDRRVALVRPVH